MPLLAARRGARIYTTGSRILRTKPHNSYNNSRRRNVLVADKETKIAYLIFRTRMSGGHLGAITHVARIGARMANPVELVTRSACCAIGDPLPTPTSRSSSDCRFQASWSGHHPDYRPAPTSCSSAQNTEGTRCLASVAAFGKGAPMAKQVVHSTSRNSTAATTSQCCREASLSPTTIPLLLPLLIPILQCVTLV